MQAGYSYDRNTDRIFLKAKLKVRKLDKQALGLYDSVDSEQISIKVPKEPPKVRFTTDMNTQTEPSTGVSSGPDTPMNTISVSPALAAQIAQNSENIANLANQNASASILSQVLRGVNNPRNINADARSPPTSVKSVPLTKEELIMADMRKKGSDLGSEINSVISQGLTPSQIRAAKAAKKKSSTNSSESLEEKPAVINDVPTVETNQIPSNIRPPILRDLPPLESSPKGSIASLEEYKDSQANPPLGRLDAFKSWIRGDTPEPSIVVSVAPTVETDATTAQMTSMAQSGSNDVANLGDLNQARGRPRSAVTSDTVKEALNEYKDKRLGNSKEMRKAAAKALLQMIKDTEQYGTNSGVEVLTDKSTKIGTTPIEFKFGNESLQGTTGLNKRGQKIIKILESNATKFLNKQIEIAGTGLNKIRIGLVARRPKKGESLPMNSILLNQLDKGNLNIITKKGNQILKQKNISSAFKRIVESVMKTGTFEADDYKMVEDKEIPVVNQFIIQTDALIPPDTPYKSTSDHVKDVKNRYSVLVGELASGNSGRIIRDEMEKILREMWRLRQITHKSFKQKIKDLQEFA